MKAERAKVRTGPEIEAEVLCHNQDHVPSLRSESRHHVQTSIYLSAYVSEPLACYSVSLKDLPENTQTVP